VHQREGASGLPEKSDGDDVTRARDVRPGWWYELLAVDAFVTGRATGAFGTPIQRIE